eukprot:547847_1
MDHDHLYWILLFSTNVLLAVMFLLSIQQFCITNPDDKHRFRRTLLVITTILGFIIENSLTYLSVIYPHKIVFLSITVTTIAILFQAVILFIGLNTFRLLLVFMINTVYDSMNIRSPKWFKFFTHAMQFIIYLSILMCYGTFFISNDVNWIYALYIILMSMVIFIAIFIFTLLQRPLKLLKQTKSKNTNNKQLKRGLLFVKISIVAAISMVIVSTGDLYFYIKIMKDDCKFSCNSQFIIVVFNSAFVIGLSICLILWICKCNTCCVSPEYSVCSVYCCPTNRNGGFFMLQDTDFTSTCINTNNIGTTNDNKISTVTTLNDSNTTNVTVKTVK